MRYSEGWNYRLEADETMQTHVFPGQEIDLFPIHLSTTGLLTLKRHFSWDGPSGPVKGTTKLLEIIPVVGKRLKRIYLRTILRASAGHDALFQLMRLGLLSRDWYGAANQSFRDICLEDGMSQARASWVYLAVNTPIGWRSTDPIYDTKIYELP